MTAGWMIEMTRAVPRFSWIGLLAGLSVLTGCSQWDSPEAVLADCSGSVPPEKVHICLDRIHALEDNNSSTTLRALEAHLEHRERRAELAQGGPPQGFQGPPPAYANDTPDTEGPSMQGPPPGEEPPPDNATPSGEQGYEPPIDEGPRGDVSPPIDETGPGDLMPPDPGAQGPPPDDIPPPDDSDTQGPGQ